MRSLLVLALCSISGCGGKALEEGSISPPPLATSVAPSVPAQPASGAVCADVPAVVGCGCAQDPVPPPEVWSCVACPGLPETSALIGPEGGSLTLRGDAPIWFKVSIPRGALAQATRIQISESVRAPASFLEASNGYVIEPLGLAFAQPVSVIIPVHAGQSGAGMYWSPDTCSEPERLADGYVTDAAASAETTHSGVVFASTGLAAAH